MTIRGLRIGLVGPLPPPEGGMANQTRQLGELLRAEGAEVTLVQVNRAYRPAWIAGVRGVRALCRLFAHVRSLWQVAGRVQLLHVMANSGWSWHLFAAPAIWVARLRGVPCVVNYRGGEAQSFLEHAAPAVRATLGGTALAVPSGFLEQVFARFGMSSAVVPNIVDTTLFSPGEDERGDVPHIVVARNLEAIYDIPTALHAFALLRRDIPGARLTVAGGGPEAARLQALATSLGIADAVRFCGRLDRREVAQLLRSAGVALNPSRVDNMPNSILEAMACGTPVVTTDAGGIPFVVKDGVTGLLVKPGDPQAMAEAMRRLFADPGMARRLRDAALEEVQKYTWARVRRDWASVYASALVHRTVAA